VISQSNMNKKEQILNTALKLFVEFGFNGTPTSKIASKSGVSNGTLFHYFKTKDELILALYISIKEELNNSLFPKINQDDGTEKIFKFLFTNTIKWALENREKYYFIQQVLFSPYITKVPECVFSEQIKMHIAFIEKLKKTKKIKDLPTDLLLNIINSHIFGIYQYLSKVPKNKQKTVVEECFNLIWDIIKN
jgi:AcrR family transcriptional regulator